MMRKCIVTLLVAFIVLMPASVLANAEKGIVLEVKEKKGFIHIEIINNTAIFLPLINSRMSIGYASDPTSELHLKITNSDGRVFRYKGAYGPSSPSRDRIFRLYPHDYFGRIVKKSWLKMAYGLPLGVYALTVEYHNTHYLDEGVYGRKVVSKKFSFEIDNTVVY